ncbi:uncharacterized protein KD926_006440 [Aspergillus affinis]|uniref:uncharacterized protein n=1 Tax=Aspergillus affinis TaxID=1070780 RepID=UPI0022FE7BE3|nr:uncharacterized protein KD926_006440 [Aspergillus affinis]KAI9041894.1 hypothetical protein KD926_006440 [Aspergillus affinis]
MVPLAFLARLLLLLAILDKGVLARRGGGDHDSDSDEDSSSEDGSSSGGSDGSGDSSSTSSCGNQVHSNALSNTYLVPSYAANWTSQGGARAAPNPTIYDGSFFQGEAHLSYNLRTGSRCQLSKELRLLGYAWIGPQPPYPKGAENPFLIGFKAWKSDKAVSEIHSSYSDIKWEGDSCSSEPDLFRITTSTSSINRDGTWDIMTLDVSPSSNTLDAVHLNATTVHELEVSKYDGLFRLRAEKCLLDDTDMHWADTTIMEGSVTNTTMELKFSGLVDMNSTSYDLYLGRDKDVKANFTITFTGQFDSANSTHALEIHKGNQTLTWVPNNAVGVASGRWAYRLGFSVGVQMIIWGLW